MIALKRKTIHPIGLHLNQRSVTLVQLDGTPGQLEIHALAQAEMPQDKNLPPQEQDRETAQALSRLIADHRFKGRRVVSCLGSEELFVQNIRLPQLPEEELEKIVSWEAEERLPYPVGDAEIRHLIAGEVRQDANVKQEVILLACHRGLIDRHISMLELAGLTPDAVDVEPCAVLRCFESQTTGSQSSESPSVSGTRCAYLNLGEKATTVMFAENQRILFLKYVSVGGFHLDQAVANHLDLELSQAARMRARVSSSQELDVEDEIHRSVIDAIRNPLESIGSEIELCLRYDKVTFRGRGLEKIIITGDNASPWLIEYFSQRLGMPGEIGNPFGALSRPPTIPASLDRPWRWTTAMGLSLKSSS